MSGDLIPAVFIGHGNPMNAIEHNQYTAAWAELGKNIPRPRGVLVVSAHWCTQGTSITAMQRPPTIHDFSGFPADLFQVNYPAPGAPLLAKEIAESTSKPVRLDTKSWGLDHGAWSVLRHVFPAADVPVVELSIDIDQSFQDHVSMARELAALRRSGVLVLASGNVVHNLSAMNWHRADVGYDWATRFDELVTAVVTTNPEGIVALSQAEGYHVAAPTPEHFIPLLYLAGMAIESGEKPSVLIRGCTYGSVSMTSFILQ